MSRSAPPTIRLGRLVAERPRRRRGRGWSARDSRFRFCLNESDRGATYADAPFLCHPDEASNASGWKDLGQRRVSVAGSGSEIAQQSFANFLSLSGRVRASSAGEGQHSEMPEMRPPHFQFSRIQARFENRAIRQFNAEEVDELIR